MKSQNGRSYYFSDRIIISDLNVSYLAKLTSSNLARLLMFIFTRSIIPTMLQMYVIIATGNIMTGYNVTNLIHIRYSDT
jgi:hypothetical protein